ncbi:site-specific DNA-methyltransferase [Chryseobacterium sp. RP-3-3]|uniref:site-specific DNA-methyltransferase (adenine-specific) n=1 Tax=Chryseobacterium antibioticum TaxID=2728847 RepID=A0A7Y0FSU5_9FLAO|nr:site-specific DNA-methyltransferase [Chryseobacterium antibioticum]NML70799.1 site-specific DNA-methyltransferase [Chryseobacterium antibioticum]
MPSLHWIGKEKVINHHQEVPYRILEKQYTISSRTEYPEATSENKIIHGDNLEALKSLLPEYEGKINCIYIDPPYNTGNEGWVYNDNVNDPKIKKWLGEVVGKESEDLTRHDKWLCMMYPRLKLLHKLLADDGAIFISIDDNEHANLKLICNEIFGSGNFIANVAVVNNFKGRSDDKYIATAHEFLLIYHKGGFVSKGVSVPEEYQNEYKQVDSNGKKYRLQGLRKRGSGAKREDRPNMFYPFYINLNANTISLERINNTDVKVLPKLSDGTDGRWRWGKETSENRINELHFQIVKGRNQYDIFQKDYLENDVSEKRIKPKSFWHGSEFSSEAGTLQLKKIFEDKSFPTPKSIDLIEYCLQQATDKKSIILDSFAGSGTTAHAVLNLNKQDGGSRKFILIEMENYAETITAERVKRVVNGYGKDNNEVEGTGGDFSYYKLGKPIFLENDLLNEEVEIEKIEEYVWYTETKEHYQYQDENYLLGTKNGTAYYFYYEKDRLTTLDESYLRTLKTKANQYIIYADLCLLDQKLMDKYHIIFKKIPRDISRF